MFRGEGCLREVLFLDETKNGSGRNENVKMDVARDWIKLGRNMKEE